ncbi:MAG: CHAT domain-containing protein [Bermanella sp.]
MSTNTSFNDLFSKALKMPEVIALESWNFNLPILESSFIDFCIYHIFEIQKSIYTQFGEGLVNEFSYIALEDLVSFKEGINDQEEIVVLNYIQFFITAHPLMQLANTGKLNSALNWIGYSLSDDLSDDQIQELSTGRLYEYMDSKVLWPIMDVDLILQWIGDFYYVCRRLSAYHNIAEELLHICDSIAYKSIDENSDEEFSWAVGCMVTWAVTVEHERASELSLKYENILYCSDSSDYLKFKTMECLSTICANYSTMKSYDWARKALKDYSHLCKGHQKLFLILNSITPQDVEYFDNTKGELISELRVVKGEISAQADNLTKIDSYIYHDRLFEMINPTIGNIMELNKGTVAVDILLDWYLVEADLALPKDRLLIIYPNDQLSLKYSVGDTFFKMDRNLKEKYSEFMGVFNDFHGVSHSIRGIPSFKIDVRDKRRMGVPDEDKSKEMEAHLVEFFGLKNMIHYMEDNKNIDSYISLPSNHHAFQYLSQKYLKTCWPLSASLEEPNLDRQMKRICLWCGAGSITEEIESNAVISILKNYNLEVDYFSSMDTTKKKFEEIYKSDRYDVIWIMSHGEFNHWIPGEVSIAIGGSEYLSLEEIKDIPVPLNDKRRLLMLNVCDGGTHSSMDGLPRLGFSPALSSRNQCVVSHLWPVNPWAAALFGACYASKLCQLNSFFLGFKSTLSALNGCNEGVMDLLSIELGTDSELLDRMKNKQIDFELMVHSGSAVFMQ